MRMGKLATYYVTRDMAPHPHCHQRHARDEADDRGDVEKTAEHWHWLVSVRDCNYFRKTPGQSNQFRLSLSLLCHQGSASELAKV